MFIRNQFSEAEQKMIRDYLALGEQLGGWVGDRPIDPQDEELNIREITRSVILMIANNQADSHPWNVATEDLIRLAAEYSDGRIEIIN